MVWKVGNGKSVSVGEDPWEGALNECKLSNNLIYDLHKFRPFF
jgi:hypothetical protein